MDPDSREAGGYRGLPGGLGEREVVTRPGGEAPFEGAGGVERELGEPEFGGLFDEPPELLLLLLLLVLLLLLLLVLLPHLEMTVGMLTKAETSEDKVELHA